MHQECALVWWWWWFVVCCLFVCVCDVYKTGVVVFYLPYIFMWRLNKPRSKDVLCGAVRISRNKVRKSKAYHAPQTAFKTPQVHDQHPLLACMSTKNLTWAIIAVPKTRASPKKDVGRRNSLPRPIHAAFQFFWRRTVRTSLVVII